MGKLRQSRSNMQSMQSTTVAWQESELDPKICHCLDIYYLHLTHTAGGSSPRAQTRSCLDSISIRHMGQRATMKMLPEEADMSSCLPHAQWRAAVSHGASNGQGHQVPCVRVCASATVGKGGEASRSACSWVCVDHPECLCHVFFRYARPCDNLLSAFSFMNSLVQNKHIGLDSREPAAPPQSQAALLCTQGSPSSHTLWHKAIACPLSTAPAATVTHQTE